MIDTEFITAMNDNVCNMALYVNPRKVINSDGSISNSFNNTDSGSGEANANSGFIKAMDNIELFCQNKGYIHMY